MMDQLFVASPNLVQISETLKLWPELSGKRIRPILVTALGDVFVETPEGDVWCADPLELTCGPEVGSTEEFKQLLAEPRWAERRLPTDVLLLAQSQGRERRADQVFGVAPHPCFTGVIRVEQLVPMDLAVWHGIATQLRIPEGGRPHWGLT